MNTARGAPGGCGSARIPGRAALAALLPLLLAAGSVKPGSYCPFPKDGAPPACMASAQSAYSELFSELAKGEVSDEQVAQVEKDVAAGATGPRAYDALSSLTYAYYLVSRRAAASEAVDPRVVTRLERWNALLGRVYEDSAGEAGYRTALREAALDLRNRAPAVRLSCKDAEGRASPCDSTEAIVRAMSDARDETGIRGAVGRLLEQLFGDEGSE